MTYSLRSKRARASASAGSNAAAAADEHLLEPRLDRDGRRAEQPIVGRHAAASRAAADLLRGRSLRTAPRTCFARRVRVREEHEAGAVVAGGRQRDAERRGDLAQEAVRHLHEDAGAVAGRRLAAAGAAVQQVDQDAQPLLDDGVRAAALDVDDEADAAGVVLVRRVVQAERPRGPPRRGCRAGRGRSWPFLRKAGVRPFAEGHRI